jgi:hypothetical protein
MAKKIKYYCDVCEQEFTETNGWFIVSTSEQRVEIRPFSESCYNRLLNSSVDRFLACGESHALVPVSRWLATHKQAMKKNVLTMTPGMIKTTRHKSG